MADKTFKFKNKARKCIHFVDDNGGLWINQHPIRRHPEKPWLFSANDVRDSIKDRILKMGERRIEKGEQRVANGEARGRVPKTPELFLKEKSASRFLKNAKSDADLIQRYSTELFKQAKSLI